MNIRDLLREKIETRQKSDLREAKKSFSKLKLIRRSMDSIFPDLDLEKDEISIYFWFDFSIDLKEWSWLKFHKIVKAFQDKGWLIKKEIERNPENLTASIKLWHPLLGDQYTSTGVFIMMTAPKPEVSADDKPPVAVSGECVVVQIGTRVETKEYPIYDIICPESAKEMGLILEEVPA